MKKIICLFFLLLLFSCGKENKEVNIRSGLDSTESSGAVQEIKQEDIKDFWDLYSKTEKQMLDSFNEGDKYQNKYIAALDEKIKEMDPSLSVEIKPNTDKERVLTITAGGIPELFPAVIKIAKAAPKDRLWKIEALKQRVKLPIIQDHKGTILDSETVEFTYKKSDDGRLELTLYYPSVTDDNLYITYIFLDGIIGEYDTAKYIRNIEFTAEKDDTYQPLENLRNILDNEIKSKK